MEGSSFEVAHEALLHGWATLARWLAEEGERRAVRLRLEASAREWERTGNSSEVLWGERALLEAKVLEPEALPEREQRFLEASRLELRRRRRRRQAMGAGFLLSLVAAVGLVQLRGAIERERAAEAELVVAREHMGQAAQAIESQERASHEAFQAFDTGLLPQAEAAWAEARRHAAEADLHQAKLGEALERALALAPGRQDVRGAAGGSLLTRAARAEAMGQWSLRDVLASRLQLVDTTGERWRSMDGARAAPGDEALGVPPHVQRYVPMPDENSGAGGRPRPRGGRDPRTCPRAAYLLTLRTADGKRGAAPADAGARGGSGR